MQVCVDTPCVPGIARGVAAKVDESCVIHGQNRIGLYDGKGNLIAETSNVTSLCDVAGIKRVPWEQPVILCEGTYFIGVLSTGMSTPAYYGAPCSMPAAFTIDGAVPPFRHSVARSWVQLPDTLSIPLVPSKNMIWVALD